MRRAAAEVKSSHRSGRISLRAQKRSLARRQHHPAFRRVLDRWFRQNKRDLPWRRTRDPYAILVSEIMLQQTQVSTVIPYYHTWVRRFPTVAALAAASESDVLHAWQGLGYYARARNLQRCAQEIMARYSGKFPTAAVELQKLPGIGRYTANAVAVFAHQLSLPLVEANTSRVIARLRQILAPIDSNLGRQKLWRAAAALVPEKRGSDFQNAMMDLGALVCVTGTPRCQVCPVREFCMARRPASLPRKRPRAAQACLTEDHEFLTRQDTILLSSCHRRWRGMWQLPAARAPTHPLLHLSQFPFTHHRITLRVSRGRFRKPSEGERWFPFAELARIPIPSPHRRALIALLPTYLCE